MMKLLYILCFFLAGMTITKGQPILDRSNFPVLGTIATSYSINDTIPESAMTPGGSQTWNFGSITTSYLNSDLLYIDPALSLFAADFPNSNICASSQGALDSSYVYYNIQPTYFNVIGNRSITNGDTAITDFVDPLTSYIFPFHFGDILDDDYESYSYSPTTDSHRTSSMSIMYYGYGTLNLPGATYPGTILLQREINSVDTLILSGTPSPRTRHSIGYIFCYPGLPSPVFSVSYDTTFFSNGNIVPSYTTNKLTIPTGVVALSGDPQFSVYPVPCKEFIFVNYNGEGGNGMLTISDLSGKQLVHQQVYSGEKVDTGSLPSGIYIVTLATEKEVHSLKIIHI